MVVSNHAPHKKNEGCITYIGGGCEGEGLEAVSTAEEADGIMGSAYYGHKIVAIHESVPVSQYLFNDGHCDLGSDTSSVVDFQLNSARLRRQRQ